MKKLVSTKAFFLSYVASFVSFRLLAPLVEKKKSFILFAFLSKHDEKVIKLLYFMDIFFT